MIASKRPDYQHEVYRIDEDGTEHPMPLTDHQYSLGYGLIGETDWESAERVLVDQHLIGQWKAGTYKMAVSRHTVNGYIPWVTVVRQLPLHEAYARLPYKPGPNDKLPARAYVHTLISRYPGATMELIAEHINDFDQHYRATISTPALALRTGYQLPPDTPRPLSPYADSDHADDMSTVESPASEPNTPAEQRFTEVPVPTEHGVTLIDGTHAHFGHRHTDQADDVS